MYYNHSITIKLMSLPLLVSGGSHQQRLDLARIKSGPDWLVIDPEKPASPSGRSIGISAVRSLEKFLQRKPYQAPVKTAVIIRAEKLTLPAQQALLKTLEEPPAHSQILLLCPSEEQLLPTIVSRCLVKRLAETGLAPGRIGPPPAEAAANSGTAREFVTNQLHYLHYELRLHPETVNIRLIKALNLALTALKFNVNPKLTLDVLSLSYTPAGSNPAGVY